jgi:hypothetical protein
MKQPRSRASESAWRPAVVRAARLFGSLQLAVTLLPTLAMVLFLGTVVESRHGRPAAADLVYRTWWFVLLLGLLAANIFCAAAKKWPWQRHQTGFIITHIGLLTLIAGGVIDSVFGTTGSIMLVSAPGGRVPQHGDFIVDRTAQRLKVRRPQRPDSEAFDAAFRPGPLAWGDGADAAPPPDALTTALAWLRDPLPAGWSGDLGDDAKLEVLTYFPHARLEPYGPAADDRYAFPAVQFQLASVAVGRVEVPRWVALDSSASIARIGPGRVEFLGQDLSAEQVGEFRHPPADTGSAADPRRGDSSARAVLQFVTDRNGRLYFRSWSSSRGGSAPAFESAGDAEPGDAWKAIWAGMDWRFRVVQFLPKAHAGLHCTPVERPASAEGLVEPPAVRCRLTHRGDAHEFWLARSDDDWTPVAGGGERFDVAYHATRHELGFGLTLVRAEQTTEAASGRPAGLTSYVLLDDSARGRHDEPHVITLNDPLAYGGYRVYQGGLTPLEPDETGRPVHRVTLLANKDPGVLLKYAGSACVALGIACMFYMRAYLFKRKPLGTLDVR